MDGGRSPATTSESGRFPDRPVHGHDFDLVAELGCVVGQPRGQRRSRASCHHVEVGVRSMISVTKPSASRRPGPAVLIDPDHPHLGQPIRSGSSDQACGCASRWCSPCARTRPTRRRIAENLGGRGIAHASGNRQDPRGIGSNVLLPGARDSDRDDA
jgi:hypothetical protein